MAKAASSRNWTDLGRSDVSVLPEPGARLDTARDVRRHRRRCPSRSRRRPQLPPRASTACPTPDDIENVVVLGMGGSGIAGDVARRRRRPVHAGARRRGRRATSAPPSSATRTLVLRRVVLGQHRGDRRGGDRGRGRRRPGGRACPPAAQLADAGRGLGGAAGSGCPTTSRCPAPASAPSPIPPLRGARATRPVPRRPRLDRRRRRPAAPAARRSSCAAGNAGRGAGPAHRPARCPIVYGGGALGAVAATPVEDPGQRERQGARRSPARYPELCHNEICGWGQHGDVTRQVFTLVQLRHDYEHPQVARRVRPRRRAGRRGRRPTSRRCGPRATGRWPSCSTSCSSATSCRCTWPSEEGIDPGPVPVLDDIKARPR